MTSCNLLFYVVYTRRESFQFMDAFNYYKQQEVKVIWQKGPHGGPIPRLGVTPGGQKLYHWIPGVGFPISLP